MPNPLLKTDQADWSPAAARATVAERILQSSDEEGGPPVGEETGTEGGEGDEQIRATGQEEEQPGGEKTDTTAQPSDEGDELDLNDIKSFVALQEAAGFDEKFLPNLTIDLGDDETPNEQSLEQLVESYREYKGRQETYEQQETRRNQEHQAARRQLQQKLDSDILQIGTFTEKTMEWIKAQLASPEMQDLRTSNPAEWAARDQELRNGYTALQQGFAGAHQEYLTQYEGQKAEFRKGELQKIKQKFSNEEDWKKGWARHTSTMREFGFSDDEIKDNFDARLIFAITELHDTRAELKALKAEKAKGTAAAAQIKKEKPPLLRKRGPDGRFVSDEEAETGKRGTQPTSQKGVRQAMQRLRKNRDMASATDVIRQRLFAVQ